MAYSSIGHIGYALAGVATGGAVSGYKSAIIYISIYVVMNIGAFSVLFYEKRRTITENISDLSGISKKHPMLSIFFNYFIFFSRHTTVRRFFCKVLCFYDCKRMLRTKMYALAIIGLLTTVVSAFYYLKIIKTIYSDETNCHLYVATSASTF